MRLAAVLLLLAVSCAAFAAADRLQDLRDWICLGHSPFYSPIRLNSKQQAGTAALYKGEPEIVLTSRYDVARSESVMIVFERRMMAAQGCFALGMPPEANAELEEIDPSGARCRRPRRAH